MYIFLDDDDVCGLFGLRSAVCSCLMILLLLLLLLLLLTVVAGYCLSGYSQARMRRAVRFKIRSSDC
jgi:hypothetical protein